MKAMKDNAAPREVHGNTFDEVIDQARRRLRAGCFERLALTEPEARGLRHGQPLDAAVLERAEALNTPIYLHPTPPPKAVFDAQYSGFNPVVSTVFSTGGWGWHIETAIHLVRMILGGVFDAYPKLQIVIGHLGEGIPFMLPRMNKNLPTEMTKLARPVGAYLRENVHYTFGGFNFTATFLNLMHEVGIDRIMFSVDYPYGSMAEARAFLEQLPISPADKERIAHGNAEKLFGF